ncbi:coproporphyrinogen-III oxidase family protein [Nonomuraea lactucae]|uniref:coproporphyrinogen-III oxidase family protein n=1 Tax=Nonomuraea lactucae TaxID=2249762 RepID=UPI000DE3AA57|nr:coproporphyrinogen-III oxidase family protein [Nonomuraea lactucae]
MSEPVRYFPRVAGEAAASRSRTVPPGPIALYVHIPFCDRRCHFCDFAVVAGRRRGDSLVDAYVAALKREMAHFRDQLREARVETLQIGGGTPTFLSARALDDLLSFVLDEFGCGAVREIVVEGYPSSITAEKLEVLQRFPALRLNVGVQTFRDDLLDGVGRGHSGADAREALAAAGASGIRDVGADIILGLPGSDVATVVADLEALSEAGVDHIALYPLWVYEGTALDRLVRRGRVAAAPAPQHREQLAAGMEVLRACGYERYSAFHYARGAAGGHLYGQWQMLANDWIGFGMSAMSSIGGTLWFNDRSVNAYLAAMAAGRWDGERARPLSDAGHMRFAFMYGLRLREFPAATFARRFGRQAGEVFAGPIRSMARRGWVEESGESIALTLDGILALGEIEEEVR